LEEGNNNKSGTFVLFYSYGNTQIRVLYAIYSLMLLGYASDFKCLVVHIITVANGLKIIKISAFS